MLIDAKDIQDSAVFDSTVCIIGGGTAGITMALELNRSGIRTAVLESGGLTPDPQTRDLNRGASAGIPYQFADGCRSRFLGGSSNCWGGWCRPFDAIDLQARSWVPDSGWPFGLDELDAYYLRAHEILKLGPLRYDTAYWVDAIARPDVRRYPLVGDNLRDAISQFSPPVRMGVDYRNELRASRHIEVYLHANVVEFCSDPDGVRITHVLAKSLRGKSFRVNASVFVLATGGIENARLLLAGSRRHPAGLGNQNDLVGRYFMDHPRVRAGSVHFNSEWKGNRLYDRKFHYQSAAVSASGTKVAAQLLPTEEVQRREGLLNFNIWFSSILPGEDTASAAAIMRMKHRWQHKNKPEYPFLGDLTTIAANPVDSSAYVMSRLLQPMSLVKGVMMLATVEPPPDPLSRVTLSAVRDSLGMPRVSIDWRLNDSVKRTFDRAYSLVAETFKSSGIASVDCGTRLEGNEWPSTFETEGTWHHMGTTRMNASPKKGVVDADCRIHGMRNLFVAGSSIFPTGGANYPTLTLVALAMRLADKLAAELRSA